MATGRFARNRLQQVLIGYITAVLATVAAALLRLALDHPLHGQAPALVFTLSVFMAAYVGGLGPGLLATGLGAVVSSYLFVHPVGQFWPAGSADQIRLALFLLTGVLISVLSERLARSRRRERAGQQSLAESERRFRGTFENASVGVAHLDVEGRWLRVNPKLCELLGYGSDELVGRHFREVSYPDDVAADLEQFERMMRGQIDQYTVQKRYIRKDGSLVWTVVKRAVQRDGSGRPEYSISIVQDFTDLQRLEEAVRREHAAADLERRRLGAVLDALPVAVFISDATGKLLQVNPAAQRLWAGRAPLSNSPADYERDYRAWWPDGRPVASHEWGMARAVAIGEVCTAEEMQIEAADGSRKTILNYALPIRDAEGKITGGVAVNVDITDRKRVEQALREAKDAAEEASRAKDHFLAVLSHELRTPMTPVVAAAAVLQDDARLPGDVREDLRMIRRNVELEKRLIDDLLDLTRIARGKFEIEDRDVDLAGVLRQAVGVCSVEADARRLTISTDIQDGHLVRGDAARLQQVFWNLLNNSIKFTEPGGRIHVSCCDENKQGQVVITVTDTGIGIEPAALGRIFDAFEQQDRAVTRRYGGLGLGLAISRAIVSLHGGSISASSRGTGTGTTFTVRLPRLREGAADHARPHRADPDAPASARRLRVLLVEDHADTARIMSRLLRASGHEVRTATTVASALEVAREQRFDLLISDLGLPDGSGHDLMRQLRAEGNGLRGIALSGYGQDADIRISHEVGFTDHVTKPVDFARLEAAIQRAMQ